MRYTGRDMTIETLAGCAVDGIHTKADRFGLGALHKEDVIRRGNQVQHGCQSSQLQHGKAKDYVQS